MVGEVDFALPLPNTPAIFRCGGGENAPPLLERRWRVDVIVCISKVTHAIVKEVSPEVSSCYLPHAVNSDIFYKFKTEEQMNKVKEIKKRLIGTNSKKKIFF